jgi:hypothetical protein
VSLWVVVPVGGRSGWLFPLVLCSIICSSWCGQWLLWLNVIIIAALLLFAFDSLFNLSAPLLQPLNFINQFNNEIINQFNNEIYLFVGRPNHGK